MSKCWYCNEELTTANYCDEHIGICTKCYGSMFQVSNEFVKCLMDKIADLEAKLAESEKQRQHLKDWLDDEILTSVDHESYYSTINEYEEEVKKLKQQLVEKEKTISELCEHSMENFKQMKEWKWQATIGNDQDKISFCIERLEKVKEEIGGKIVSFFDNYGDRCIEVVDLESFIDNQIKQLKEMK